MARWKYANSMEVCEDDVILERFTSYWSDPSKLLKLSLKATDNQKEIYV